MADAKITALTENTTPLSTDLLPMVDDPAGTPATQKITIDNVKKTAHDGWLSANESWAYASANTITVPSGAASKYAVGDRIKWTQTTVRYGVIVTVANTVLTIAVNTDYVVDNAAITLNYYSHEVTPIGFPTSFIFAPGWAAVGGGSLASIVTSYAKFSIFGNVLFISAAGNATPSGTVMQITFNQPVATSQAVNTVVPTGGAVFDGGVWKAATTELGAAIVYIYKVDGTVIGTGATKYFNAELFYRI